MNNLSWPHFAVLAQFVLFFGVTACFGPPLEEEPTDVNTPPHIADDFLNPAHDVIRVESDDIVELGIDTLLDQASEDRLYYAVIGERSGLIEQASASRRPTDERYRDIFVQYDGVDIEIDPCTERLREGDDELLRVFVTDRPFERVTDAGVDVTDDAYVVSHRWLLRFRSQLCD